MNKTFILLLILLVAAIDTWKQAASGAPVGIWIAVGAIGGFATALLTVFVKKLSPYTAPVYAALEGLFLGALSAQYEAQFPGIVIQAVIGTMNGLPKYMEWYGAFGLLVTLIWLYIEILRLLSKLKRR